MNLDRLAACVVFNKKKKLPRVFSSRGSFLGGVGKNVIFNDHSNVHWNFLAAPKGRGLGGSSG